MSAEAWDMIITAAEEGGLFVERDLERDIEKAKEMLLDGAPVEKVSKWMKIPIETLRAFH